MTTGIIHRVLADVGTALERGVPLVEVRVDLSAVAEQNCVPVSYFRIVAAEGGWLRSLDIAVGDKREVGATLGIVSVERDEPIADEAGARALRVSVGAVNECTG